MESLKAFSRHFSLVLKSLKHQDLDTVLAMNSQVGPAKQHLNLDEQDPCPSRG